MIKLFFRWMHPRHPAVAEYIPSYRQIYVLPTWFAWQLAAIAAAIWLGSLQYGLGLGYWLAYWLVAIGLVSIFLTYRQLLDIRVRMKKVDPCFAGQEVCFEVELAANSARHHFLYVHPYAYKEKNLQGLSVSSEQPQISLIRQQAQRRGKAHPPMLKIYTEAPFGLVRAFTYVQLTSYGIVYPEPIEDATQGILSGEQGSILNQKGDEEFSHLELWRLGESTRGIDWKAFARGRPLLSKHFSGSTLGDEIQISWQDYPAQMAVEEKLSRMAWRVLKACKEDQAWKLILPTQTIGYQPYQQVVALTELALWGEYEGEQE